MGEYIAIIMFVTVFVVLLLGYPVAFSLAATALFFALAGSYFELFDPIFLSAMPSRLYGIMTNETLMAVPLFIFMGLVLEKSRIAENLLEDLATLFGRIKGGMGFSVVIVGLLLAASTGIVGATVVTMGLLAMPALLKHGYSPSLSAGTICAAGTLGQIIPPSIVLVILGDVLSSAYQQAQIEMGVFSPETVSIGDLFAGAIIPGLILVVGYLLYLSWQSYRPGALKNQSASTEYGESQLSLWRLCRDLFPPIMLMVAVLGSILAGVATPTEAASLGAAGALILAITKKQCRLSQLQAVMQDTVKMTCMVFMILIGASVFALVFRGFGGDDVVRDIFSYLPGGVFGAVFAVMVLIFLLGFMLDFIEIIFVVVPIVGPVLLAMSIDPVWLGIMIAMNIQTSFLTPPFGFSIFYLRGVAPDSVSTLSIYRGVVPFIGIQLVVLGLLAWQPQLVTWLPEFLSGY